MVKVTLSPTDISIMVARDLAYFSAIKGGIVRRAMTNGYCPGYASPAGEIEFVRPPGKRRA